MIEPKQLKVGLLVWWTAERTMSPWNCPGVITKVDEANNIFRVKTFDTMEETANRRISRPAGDDKSSLEEMEVTTDERVLHYIQEQEDLMKAAILKKEHELGQLRGKADQYSKKAAILREELSSKPIESILPKT